MTDTAKNSAAAEEGVYETPEDIAAEAAKPAERAARTDADSPIAPWTLRARLGWGGVLPWAETGEGDCSRPTRRWKCFGMVTPAAWSCGPTKRTPSWT